MSISDANSKEWILPDIPKLTKGDIVHAIILQEIRDLKVLSNVQLYHLRKPDTSRTKLIEIIEQYNLVIRNINEII